MDDFTSGSRNSTGGLSVAAPPFVTYYGVDDLDHQQRIDELTPLGYRMISLSTFGTLPRYAAVWVRRPGPDFRTAYGLSGQQFRSTLTAWAMDGFRPTIVAATGSYDHPVLAVVAERTSAPEWSARYGLAEASLAEANDEARQRGMMLRSLAVYNSAASPVYAAVWGSDPKAVRWQGHPAGDGDPDKVHRLPASAITPDIRLGSTTRQIGQLDEVEYDSSLGTSA